MDETEATDIAQHWSGSRGLVPRGPRWLLGYTPADPRDVERHIGHRPAVGMEVWRIEVGGRFLQSGGTVYPGGVPFPEELAGRTATISSEVWLYVDDRNSRVMGMHSWPEAVRRPVAAPPEDDYPSSRVHAPEDAVEHLDIELPMPVHPDWWPALVVCKSRTEAIVFLARKTVPDPVNEMLLFQEGGVSLRVSKTTRPDLQSLLRAHQPPFRRLRAGQHDAIGREPGRSLGPQTWPWPGELLWWRDGFTLELKGFAQLETLTEISRTI